MFKKSISSLFSMFVCFLALIIPYVSYAGSITKLKEVECNPPQDPVRYIKWYPGSPNVQYILETIGMRKNKGPIITNCSVIEHGLVLASAACIASNIDISNLKDGQKFLWTTMFSDTLNQKTFPPLICPKGTGILIDVASPENEDPYFMTYSGWLTKITDEDEVVPDNYKAFLIKNKREGRIPNKKTFYKMKKTYGKQVGYLQSQKDNSGSTGKQNALSLLSEKENNTQSNVEQFSFSKMMSQFSSIEIGTSDL